MAKFCAHCGQAMPGSEERADLFDSRLIIRPEGMEWEGGGCRLTKLEAQICMAMARTFPRPASPDFTMDYLENSQAIDFQAEESKIIDVVVCRIRKKMLENASPFHIVTTWGVGKQFAEGAANGPIVSASAYPRDQWKEARNGNRC